MVALSYDSPLTINVPFQDWNLEALRQRTKRFIKSDMDDDFPHDEEFEEASEDRDEPEPQLGEAKRVLQASDEGEDIPQASQQDTPRINYRKLNLTENPNFFNIPVNTEHSAVHVPSNVFDRCKYALPRTSATTDTFLPQPTKLSAASSGPRTSTGYSSTTTATTRPFPGSTSAPARDLCGNSPP